MVAELTQVKVIYGVSSSLESARKSDTLKKELKMDNSLPTTFRISSSDLLGGLQIEIGFRNQ